MLNYTVNISTTSIFIQKQKERFPAATERAAGCSNLHNCGV